MRRRQDQLRPPALARRVLTFLAGTEAAEEAEAGLGELFQHRVRRDGRAPARRWYWRQVLGFALRWRSVRTARTNTLGATLQDIGFGLRVLRNAPVFTLVSMLTLALGIGASLAMFGIVDASLIRPLPYAEPGQLVIGRATNGGELNPWVAAPDYVDYRTRAETFEDLGAILPFAVDATVIGQEGPERVTGTTVSTDFFRTLGVAPQVGRSFAEEEGAEGAPAVLLVSHGYWQNRLGARPDVVGRSLNVDGVPFSVIGVMPADFHFLLDVDFWLPMRPDRDAASMRDRHNWYVVGRLGPDVSIEQAQSNVDVISAQLQAAYPDTNARKALLLTDLRSVLVEDYRARLAILTAAALLVLIIACGNVAGMMLARAPARRRELSVRAALGAGTSRLTRQLLSEGVVLAVGGGVLGLAVATGLQQLALSYLQMDQLGLRAVEISTPMLLVTLAVSLGTGVVAALYPAVRNARSNLSEELKVAAGRLGGGGSAFRSALVVAQISVSIMLLMGSGLLIRSLLLKKAVEPGFDASGVLTAEIMLPPAQYPPGVTRAQFFSELVADVGAMPGVASSSAVSHVPLRHPRNRFRARGPNSPVDGDGESVFLRSALPDYFETMTIPLVAGRGFEETDGAGGPRVAVINRSLARVFFGEQNPLGQQVELNYFGQQRPLEVVGVATDVHIRGLGVEPGLTLYVPHAQLAYGTMQLVVRSAGDLGSVTVGIRSALTAADEDIPLSGLATMEDVVAESLSEHSVIALSLTIYALLPLLIAAVGLYAVVANYVSQRLHEIGIRMALGAEPRSIGILVLGRGLVLVSLGVAIGLAGALAGTRLLRQMLFGVQPTDPGTFVIVTGLVVLVAMVACAVPVTRAVRSDPTVVLQAM